MTTRQRSGWQNKVHTKHLKNIYALKQKAAYLVAGKAHRWPLGMGSIGQTMARLGWKSFKLERILNLLPTTHQRTLTGVSSRL